MRSPSRGVDPDVHAGMELGREISRAREQSLDRVSPVPVAIGVRMAARVNLPS